VPATTLSTADMSARLAGAAPGATVTVFEGTGQRLGLVGGVVYEHPIAVTAIPAAGVAALLAAILNQSAAVAGGPGGGATGSLGAGDLAQGFPALEIRVDSTDRLAEARVAWCQSCFKLAEARERDRDTLRVREKARESVCARACAKARTSEGECIAACGTRVT
jgi:hypothetical protein